MTREPWQPDEDPDASIPPAIPIPPIGEIVAPMMEALERLGAKRRPLFPFVMDGGTYLMRDDSEVFFWSDGEQRWVHHSTFPTE